MRTAFTNFCAAMPRIPNIVHIVVFDLLAQSYGFIAKVKSLIVVNLQFIV
jgi:hypothetical protein